MGYSYNAAASSFPGLWPGTLFGYEPIATAFPAAQQQLFPGGNAGGDLFAMGGGVHQNAYAAMQQQMLAAMMMQSMLDLLVQYFAQQMGGGPSSQVGALGGGGGGWSSGGRGAPWGVQPASTRGGGGGGGGGGARRTGGGHGHDHGRTDGPRSHGQTGIPNGLRQNAANGARVVRELGFDGTIGGLGHRAGRSDHPHGNAIDVMTHGDRAMGHRVAEHFRQNHEQLGVKYVIYEQRIASPRTGWQWRPMEDRGNPTANHMDHPHISFH